MKKSMFMGAVVAVAAMASAVQAGQVTFYGNGEFRQGTGGEFQARVWSGNTLNPGTSGKFSDTGPSVPGGQHGGAYRSFQTFCLEVGENVDLYTNDTQANNPSNRVTVSVAPYAVSGGAGAIIEDGESRDYISSRTAFLYTQFRNGNLNRYTYDNNNITTVINGQSQDRSNTAEALQLAFWYLEEEKSAADLDGTSPVKQLARFYAGLASPLGTLDLLGWTGIGNVRVMNYTRIGGQPGQSMLTIIPLPTAGGLAMAGLLGCGMTRRRFN